MKNLDVIIVGAGIGGLQTALALAADGHKVTVVEAVKEFAEVSWEYTFQSSINLLRISTNIPYLSLRSAQESVFLPTPHV